MTATFDTLEYVETLKAAGVPEEQAKAHVKAMSSVAGNTLATKADLTKTKTALSQDIKELEHRLTIKAGTMFVISVGIILAGIKYL